MSQHVNKAKFGIFLAKKTECREELQKLSYLLSFQMYSLFLDTFSYFMFFQGSYWMSSAEDYAGCCYYFKEILY